MDVREEEYAIRVGRRLYTLLTIDGTIAPQPWKPTEENLINNLCFCLQEELDPVPEWPEERLSEEDANRLEEALLQDELEYISEVFLRINNPQVWAFCDRLNRYRHSPRAQKLKTIFQIQYNINFIDRVLAKRVAGVQQYVFTDVNRQEIHMVKVYRNKNFNFESSRYRQRVNGENYVTVLGAGNGARASLTHLYLAEQNARVG